MVGLNCPQRIGRHVRDLHLGGAAFDLKSEEARRGNPLIATASARGGRVKYRYKPSLNTPGTVPETFSPTQGEVTYHEYANDVFGAPTRPALVQTSVNGTMVAKEVTTYNDSYGTANGLSIAESVRTEYSSATEYLQATLRYYRDDTADAFVRGQTHSVTAPGGVKKSFAYQRGTWNGSTFTPGTGIGTGTASRISVLTGSSSSAAGSANNALDSYALDTVYLVAGQSTRDATIRDSRGLVVRTESHLWQSGTWLLVSSTNYTYDYAGRLTNRVGSNSATYEAVYDGGLKTSETDEAGVRTEYTYDVMGRVSLATRTGSGVVGALATKYTYDASGQVTKEEVGYGQTGVITTQRQFDDAGRLTSETPPGGYGAVSHTYDVANRVRTTTRADGSTVIATDYLDGRRSSQTGTGIVAEYHTYGVETDGRRWAQVNVGASNSPRWEKAWQDWMGRGTRKERPGYTNQPNVVTENFYHVAASIPSKGHLAKTTRTGYAPTLYEYNYLGQVSRSGLDYDNNGSLDLVSNDRITETESYLEYWWIGTDPGWWRRTDTRTYPKPGLNTVLLSATTRTRLTGHPANRLAETQSIDAEGNVTTQRVEVNRSARTAVATITQSGVSGSRVENTVNGLSVSVTNFDGLTTTRGYDSFLRPSTVGDSRGHTTTTAFVAGTTLVHTLTNAAGNTSVTTYDAMGRVNTQCDPKNHYTRFSYNARGQINRQWGDGAIPVEYGYDSTSGARTTMSTFRGGTDWAGTTWPSSPGTADTTTWAYDGPSGSLVSKTDAPTTNHPNGSTVTQSYNQRGQTATRTLARGVVTTYGYDNATGELLSQSYSDTTPGVTYTYGRTGQVETISDFTGTRDLVYDASKPWRLVAEVEAGFYGSRAITRLYDASGIIGRVRGFQVGAAVGSASDLEQAFGFTTVGRLETIATSRLGESGTLRRFRYGYLWNAALLEKVEIDDGAGPGGHPFIIRRTYDTQRDLVAGIEATWNTAVRTGYSYTYDECGQRSKAVQSGGVFSDYGGSENGTTAREFGYNGRGEITAEIGYLGSSITASDNQLPGRRHEYGYDNAGNRLWSNRSGNATLRDDYTTNALNQYATRENNTLPVSGTAAAGPSPTTPPVNLAAGETAVAVQGGTLAPVRAGRKGLYWSDELTVNNNADPLNPNPWRGAVTIFTAKAGASGSPDVYRVDIRMAEMAARLQTFTYDADGNLTSDGVVDYQWDAENRLIRMETTETARTWNFPHRLLEFRYDYLGRRVQKRVIDVTLGGEISCRRLLYDGWNLIAEFAAPGGTLCGALLRSYTWGLDIVNTMATAGGVGALLQIADHPSGKAYLPTYDGNGNIIALINAAASGESAGAIAAVYEYGPFGEPLRAQTLDPTVTDNAFRFSTKWTDLETGLVYYGRRYYDPKNGRFINRDPIEEAGGINLYGFCGNNAVNRWDLLGYAWNVELTREGTFLASSVDSNGNVGRWNFSNFDDAQRWGQAWEDHDMGVVGDRAVTDNYLNPDPNGVVDPNAGMPDFSIQILAFSWDPPPEQIGKYANYQKPAIDGALYAWSAPIGTVFEYYGMWRNTSVGIPSPNACNAIAAVNSSIGTSLANNEEFGGILYSHETADGTRYGYTTAQLTNNGHGQIPGGVAEVGLVPYGANVYGWWHTHGNQPGDNDQREYFSTYDVDQAKLVHDKFGSNIESYVGTPRERILAMPWTTVVSHDPNAQVYGSAVIAGFSVVYQPPR